MDLRSILMGLVFVTIWASAFSSARIAMADAPPFLFLTVRFLVSGLIAVCIAWAMGQHARLSGKQWWAVILFGFCQNTLYLGFNFTAMQWVEASVAVIIASALPLLVAATSWIVLGERLKLMAVLGMLAGFGGVVLIMTSRLSGGADPIGVAFCVAGVLALTIATMLVRGASSSGNILMIVGLQMLVGSATLFPLSLAFETWEVNWTISLGLAFIYTTLMPGLIATLVWFALVERIGATRAATFHFLNPFIGVTIASIVLSETMSIRDGLGVAIVMGGILAVQVSMRRNQPS